MTEKSDVYSFGVVLLEIITAKPAIIEINQQENTHLSQWVNSFLMKGDIKHIIDPRLEGNFDTNSVWKAVEVAMACLSHVANRRPTMTAVLIQLKECLETEITGSGKADNGMESRNSISHIMSMNLGTDSNPEAR